MVNNESLLRMHKNIMLHIQGNIHQNLKNGRKKSLVLVLQ
jgi:uncharacterized protein YbgA (DUF1722 family)